MNARAVWQNRSPGDLERLLPEICADDPQSAVERSVRSFREWSRTSVEERIAALRLCQERLKARQEDLAALISLEMGKPIREARMELAGVIAKFDLTFADAERYFIEQPVIDGPHPAAIRHRPRGPAAVIAPFNFPIHLGHGATVAYLVAGNTVLFKPSPLAANVGAAYLREMQACLPHGVLELVQGGGDVGRALCLHPDVRSVCFTGSVPVGQELSRELAGDYSKVLALELGGKNSLILLEDADLDLAAAAAADAMCLTTGQRCNATSRILVHRSVERPFIQRLLESLERYQFGDPLLDATMMGPLVSSGAVERYQRLTALKGDWVLPGRVDLSRGHYVTPAVRRLDAGEEPAREEMFSPIAEVSVFDGEGDALRLHNQIRYGLTASIFTRSEQIFRTLGEGLTVGNLYWNLPTTFSPSTLPFGGLGLSGNGRPGGRGFIRYAADEQAVQWK